MTDDTDCPNCPSPPYIGQPQPDRCERCPYRGYVHTVEEMVDGGRMHYFGLPGEDR